MIAAFKSFRLIQFLRPAIFAALAGLLVFSVDQSVAEQSPVRLYPSGTLPLQVPETPTPIEPSPVIPSPETIKANLAIPGIERLPEPATNPLAPADTALPKSAFDLFATTNTPKKEMSAKELLTSLQQKLEMARYQRAVRQTALAEPLLVELLSDESPESIRQSALLELAAASQDQLNFPRAQQIFSQFLAKWPNDARVPEILFRQGQLFRQMGLNNMALTKFYGVMTSALVLQNDQMEYYIRLVQQAQLEIAETHFALGKYSDAAEFFSRMMKQTNSVNKAQILYKLTRCHSALNMNAETIANGQDFLARYSNAVEKPEIRFLLAVALKNVGRNHESLQQVLLLMQEQHESTKDRPAVWAYWQQRAGNLIGNHLYAEGDYSKALDVYLNLSKLDNSPTWQLPVNYQIGMTYERLWQPQKAAETYLEILSHEKELATNSSPSLKAVFEMARWRANYLDWQSKAEEANRRFQITSTTNASLTANAPVKNLSTP
jgi:TolA-binding protein